MSRLWRGVAARAKAAFGGRGVSALSLLGLWLTGCAAPTSPVEVLAERRRGTEIAVCGRFFDCDTRIVLWSDPTGYDAYRQQPFFPAELAGKDAITGDRYGARRGLATSATLADVQRVVDQFVIHYDVCGTARQCFKILHDHRKLSVHFLLDVDGTLYQTLDLRERAWHATKANDRAVGIELAHIGAYPRQDHRTLVEWYRHDEEGPFIRFPPWMKATGLPSDFVGRPARREIVRGTVQGQDLWQYDFTEPQYVALAKLTATLSAVLPSVRLEVPHDDTGALRTKALTAPEFDAWQGLLGHFHVQTNKTDPGPAFDWQRLLRDAAGINAGRP